MEQNVCTIGQSVVINGELRAEEDLVIEGQVEGTIEVTNNFLTIGTNARINANVLAKMVVVKGKVNGNITATETINVHETAAIEGKLAAPCVGMAEGASFRGEVDMQRRDNQRASLREKDTPETALLPHAVEATTH